MNRAQISAANCCGGLFAALLCFLTCEAHAVQTPSPGELIWANSGFAFNLFKQLIADQPETNIFISPYSASTVLQMVCSGAAGATSTEMQQMLGTIDMPSAALYEANKEISDMINAANTNFVLTAANAIWYKKGFQVEPAFIQRNEDYFGAEVAALNFSAPASVGIINAWASEKTQGKIDQIVSPPLDSAIRLLLANAVYFHGNWEYQFDTNYTTNRIFELAGGAQESIPMMEQTASFSYCATNGYQAVRLPYKGSNLAMYVFLPGPDSSLGELLGTMSGQWWQQTISGGFADQTGTIILPRFNLNYSANLNEPLQALGMVSAFSPDADFSKISRDSLHVSEVKQQAIVEVNEEGTVAAAVTTVTVVDSAVPAGPPPFLMIVNRPFVFFIEDQQAGTILFMGAVFEP